MSEIIERQVLDIWQLLEESYPNGAPWNQAQLRESLEKSYIHVLEIRQDNQLVAVLIYHQLLDESELIQIGVKPAYQNQHLAQKLMVQWLAKCVEESVTQCFLEVRVSNLKAQHVYQQQGFQPIATRKNYYQDPVEDAWIYQKKLEC